MLQLGGCESDGISVEQETAGRARDWACSHCASAIRRARNARAGEEDVARRAGE